MRVSNKMIYSNYSLQLMQTEAKIQKSTRQISTGKRIEMPSDDPIGTSQAMSYRSELIDIERYTGNSYEAVSWYTATDDALTTLNSDLQRVRELVVAGANDTLNSQGRRAMADEIDQLRNAIMQIANSSLNNRYIFAGQKYTEKAYETRTVIAGDALNLNINKITIDQYNNQFQIKLDDDQILTVNLNYPKTYDGTPGNTLDDLADDIERQFHYMGFDVPIHARVTPDNTVQFYAGTNPPDKDHMLILKDGPAIKTVGTTTVPLGPDMLTLDAVANNINDYYNGWQVEIIGGKGKGQLRTIVDYNGGTQTITDLNADWDVIPDATSQYRIIPPLEGTATTVTAGNTVVLPGLASDINDFYTGMDITFYDDKGQVVDSQTITGYIGGAHQISIAAVPGWAVTGTYKYTISPHLEENVATAVPAGGTTLDLDTTNANMLANFYNGASVTVTHENGVTETRKITNYTGAPANQITVDHGWDMPITTACTYKIGDSTLGQLGFENKATTKELLSVSLPSTINIQGKYPFRGKAQAVGGSTFDLDSSTPVDDYTNWTVTITKGAGAGRSYTVTGTVGAQLSIAPAIFDPALSLLNDSEYALTPPLTGTVPAIVANNQIRLSDNSSMTPDFYKGMTVEIFDGFGVGQKRTIVGYTPGPPNIATLDPLEEPWNQPPNTTSRYVIDANYYVNANNKIQIKVGIGNPQEISLDGGDYTPFELAQMLEKKIQERGNPLDPSNPYNNIRVYATPDNQLRIVPIDPDANHFDNPLSIALYSGSQADALHLLGFVDGTTSGTGVPNFQGNKGEIEYQINLGVKIQINTIGDRIFDPIFKHLTRISIDLRSDNTMALSGEDLKNIQNDIDQVLMAQGELGAKSNRVDKAINRLESLNENVTKLLSNVEDTDLSRAVIDLRMKETAYQAALQAGGRILPMTLLDYLK